ncbi:RNA-binding cell elongation regulator Jag/EloR [Marasmitruncus massiliensis]|uniref:RNA-binding cell elongation regulator Jag/EloR n=1 Tax=Marasmitruncus massiliensis TaxID=1944642 RepID=UPI000C7CABB7|nr:RNA-binding cell elongation regulator Jag/EloR [Marasmitruncus massiliensis]
MKESIKEARNVEEAIELACRELGMSRDEVEFEIISLPKRGFLGLRNTPAKVRVYVEEPEQAIQETRVNSVQERERKADRPSKPVQPKPEPKQSGRQEAQIPEKIQASAPQKETEPVELKFVSAEEVDGKAKTAADYVRNVLAEMGVTAGISVAFTENGIILRLSGEGLGVIIGRRGETLDALQHLAGLVANRQEGDYMRVTIDSGNYREKREHTLEQLAKKLSASAIRYGRPSTLEPMNPYERRIIHSTVSKIEGVSSSSIGEEPNRRVVITPDRLRPQGNRGGRGKSGKQFGDRPLRRNDRREGGENQRRDNVGRGNGNGSRPPFNRERTGEVVRPTPTNVDRVFAKELEQTPRPVQANPQPAEKPVPARTEVRKEGDDLPLYGKIEL